MDGRPERLEALEHQVQTLHRQTRTIERQLRWWRGLAVWRLVLALLTWALPSSTAQEDPRGGQKGLADRVAALETLLKPFTRVGHEVVITGANLHLVNGLGSTDCTAEQDEPIPDCPNGLGNLIVGYNEPREFSDEHSHRLAQRGGRAIPQFLPRRGIGGGRATTRSAGTSRWSAAGNAIRPAATGPPSVGGSPTRPAATMPWSAGGSSTRPAGSPPPSVGEAPIWPVGRSLRSVAGRATRPAMTSQWSVAGAIGRPQAGLTGSRAPSSKTSRHRVTMVGPRASGVAG